MISRRSFAKLAVRSGIAAATAPLWKSAVCAKAFAQLPISYKALVVITLEGGNDGNNVLIPLDASTYAQYSALRSAVALPQSACHVLNSAAGSPSYGLHPSLVNVAALYNAGSAAVIANVGPIARPATKSQILQNPDLIPPALMSHPAGVNQWESATMEALPTTGWGGRIADLIASQSGSLPPVFDAAGESIFTVGRSVQAISVNVGGGPASPQSAGLQQAMLEIAQNDALSENQIIARAAALRIQALNDQALISQAQSSAAPLRTTFPTSGFGQAMQAIASIINGRDAIGATRQIFYAQQGIYDTHQNQMGTHASYLSELDGGLGALMSALQEMGLSDQVLVCTHSDFNRTFIANTAAGTDHAWGNHQLVLGGGIRGGRIIGSFPDLDLGGSMDFNGYGIWIPTISACQMAAGMGNWMGLSASQLGQVFPDLANFPNGAIAL